MTQSDITAAKKYARAMIEVLAEKDQLDDGYEELVQLRQIFNDNPTLADTLQSSRTTDEQRQNLLKPILENGSEFLVNLFNVINDYHRYDQLVPIVDQFESLYDDQKSIVKADVISATELTDDQQSRIADAFANRVGAKKVVLTTKTDKSLMGGVILRSEDVIIDGSVKTRIEKVKEMLLN
ncbi:ATP synthase F1 subunit delta [Lentilactobacillus sp. Marseille-Q4993]|uniref:ATP synthase F1 subunit delta n=1 Tax=Lentilactobacillus sp. Marseille-Q4993 TaxID=3039492 RepID=UPI0024BD215C|nr:ATP synthase F1 subunit delta [Lentilactobacillus sp. Marseille-Q4993]